MFSARTNIAQGLTSTSASSKTCTAISKAKDQQIEFGETTVLSEKEE